jgi:hypothetical protein
MVRGARKRESVNYVRRAILSGGNYVVIEWYCGHYVGPFRWKFSGDWILEPDECATTFTTEDTQQNWDDNCCTATCPECGAELSQEYDVPILME